MTLDLGEELHRALRVRVALDPEVPDAQSYIRGLLLVDLADEITLARLHQEKRRSREDSSIPRLRGS
jgi:hypothetical protein